MIGPFPAHKETMSIFRPVILAVAVFASGAFRIFTAEPVRVEVSSLEELERVASANDQVVHMKPGVYRFGDFLTPERIEKIGKSIDRSTSKRPPVPMLHLKGDGNRLDLAGVVFEIDTSLYPKMPSGYLRAILLTGSRNAVNGLTIRNAGEDRGSNGNLLSVLGEDNVMENVTLHVFGSYPHGYGDLLGKGGPNLVNPLLKQSGFMIGGKRNVVRRCKVFSRAFGHCFYIQNAEGAIVEDCYAEGQVRPTSEMLRDTSGPAFDLGFKSVYMNRDGRSEITPGYMKSLSEDGFRTYGGVSRTIIRNCTAVNTRAGFEIAGNDTDADKTVVEGCLAKGCERGYLIGSNTIVRRSRGDVLYGPLLYLRGGRDSDVELEVSDETSNFTVHALATIAGANHRVKFFAHSPDTKLPAIPILLGYAMPQHAEMSSPINPAPTENIHLVNELERIPVIQQTEAVRCEISSKILKTSEKASEKIW